MVWKGCFYVTVSLCRQCESNIFVVRAAFSKDAYHVFPQSVLAVVLLMGVWLVLWWPEPAGDVAQGLLFSLWLSQPCVEAPRFSSKLQCEVGTTGVLTLGKELLHIPPQGLSAGDMQFCDVTPHLLWVPTKCVAAGATPGLTPTEGVLTIDLAISPACVVWVFTAAGATPCH